jgi:VanZ family protein
MSIDLRFSTNDKNFAREILVQDVFFQGLHYIVITFDQQQLAMYINGKKHYESQDLRGVLDNWYRPAFLLIGNGTTGRDPYNGKLHKIGIYKRALSEDEILDRHHAYRSDSGKEFDGQTADEDSLALYDFESRLGKEFESLSRTVTDINLVIPDSFRVWHKLLLNPYNTLSLSRSNIIETALNILMFIPFGFILKMRSPPSRNPWFVGIGILLLGLFCTILFEIAQFFVESRSSSLRDVTLNTIGVFVGMCIPATKYGRKFGLT